MAYDIHITRREYWSDDGAPEISASDWAAHVASDPQIAPDQLNGEHDFVFLAHPQGAFPIFWSRGEILISGADDAMLSKAIAIAAALNAKVLGDDDEQYTAVDVPPISAS